MTASVFEELLNKIRGEAARITNECNTQSHAVRANRPRGNPNAPCFPIEVKAIYMDRGTFNELLSDRNSFHYIREANYGKLMISIGVYYAEIFIVNTPVHFAVGV